MYDTSEDEGPSRELYYNEEVQVEEDGQDSDEEAGEMSPGVAGTRGKEKQAKKTKKRRNATISGGRYSRYHSGR